MSKRALTNFSAVCLAIGGIVPALFAGPEPIRDNSKDKEIPIMQQPVCDPRWYINIGGGADFSIGSAKVVNGFDNNFTAEVPFFGGSIPTPAHAAIQSRDWNDLYDDTWRVQGEVGYVLTGHLEVFGLFKYAHADASGFSGIGDLSVVDPFGGPPAVIPLNVKLGDFTSYGGELGFRFFFLPKDARFRPYISFSGGATHVDSIDATITADTTTVGGPTDFLAYRGGFFDDSWTATGAAMLGMEVRVACRWSLGVEGGIRYESKLSENDGDLKGVKFFDGSFATPLRPFRAINDNAGDRWTIPVNGYVKFRF